jgi:hypothetical protein
MFAFLTIRIPVWLDRICVWPLLLYRRITFGEPYRKIDLGEGAYTIVDPDIYYEKCQYKWFLVGAGHNEYPIREKKIGPYKTVRMSLHREIMKPRKGKLIDHRDNNPFNNLKSNLREATRAQNAQNRPKAKIKASSKYRGVSWNKSDNRWLVRISWQKKGRRVRKIIGLFRKENEIEAARAFDMAALKYHKDFANTNFPREDYIKTKSGYKFAGDTAGIQQNQKDTDLHGLTRFFSFFLLPFYVFSVNSVCSVAKTSVAKADKNPCPQRSKISKICLSILSYFRKKRKRQNYERNTLRQRPIRESR